MSDGISDSICVIYATFVADSARHLIHAENFSLVAWSDSATRSISQIFVASFPANLPQIVADRRSQAICIKAHVYNMPIVSPRSVSPTVRVCLIGYGYLDCSP